MIDRFDLNQLETMIDQYGLDAVTDAIADICIQKTEHVLTNWQDADLAEHWNKAAKIVNAATGKILDLKL